MRLFVTRTFAMLVVAASAHGADPLPGVVAQYHGPDSLPDGFVSGAPLPAPDHVELLADFAIDVGATIGGSPYTTGASVRLVGNVPIPFDETYTFYAKGGTSRELRIDGQLVDGPIELTAGTHAVDARFSLVDVDEGLPLFVAASVGGILPVALANGPFTHDPADELPAIHALPTGGSAQGGETITLEGFGFTPAETVVVHFGNTLVSADDGALVTPDAIVFTSPPHAPGDVFVSVETPQGTSNTRTFTYTADGALPTPEFELSEEPVIVEAPIAGAWGHDGHLYVGLRSGHVAEIVFDDDLVPVDTIVHEGVSQLEHVEILGLTTSPWETSGEVVLYVAHTTLFAYGGTAWFAPAPYIGAVSVLRGPTFDLPEPLITGLPTSNHDHGPNALVFDHNGDLLVSCGGTTNAGVQSIPMGSLSESPLSGAVLKARTSDPDFNGVVEYVLTTTGQPIDDQQVGFETEVAAGVDVAVHAAGLRNTFDMLLATNGSLYATDNGPNIGFGPALLGETVLGPEVAAPDEVLLVEAGNYYGHPNLARGAQDAAQFVYRDTLEPSIPEDFTQALAIVDSSTNGIVEYRAQTFWGQWRGDLLVQRFNGLASRLELSDDGRHVLDVQPLFPPTGGLNLLTAPGGAIVSLAYSGGVVRVLEPVDDGVAGVTAYDIHPWRAPATGGTPFVIGGRGFTSPEQTSVHFGDVAATLTKVTPRRIEGLVPELPDAGTELIDVTVVSGAERSVLSDAFRALLPIGTEPGRWLPTAAPPVALSDVASDVIGSTLYAVGFGSPSTLALDLYDGSWSTSPAPRPIVARGQAACALDGKLYVVGGTGAASAGRLQIYDPAADLWTLGPDMPWAGGSVAAAAIDGRLYVAGGVIAGTTTDRCASYDPTADAWTSHARMPFGRHFASAGALDGRLWLFGGWSDTPGGFTSDHTEVQVYEPALDVWFESDAAPGLEPMPVGRGGMGRAVFWQGEFYLFGGALQTDTASAVIDRVDAYDPATATWRVEAPMPTGRQGISPALFEGRTVIVGGSDVFGVVPTTTAETFTRQ